MSKQEGKSKIFKPASCERVKDEAAGGGHRAARVLTTCVLRMQRAEKRVWAGAELLSCPLRCDLSISRTQKDKVPLQFAAGAFIRIRELMRVFRAAALDSLHWWYLHLLLFVDCRALNNSG